MFEDQSMSQDLSLGDVRVLVVPSFAIDGIGEIISLEHGSITCGLVHISSPRNCIYKIDYPTLNALQPEFKARVPEERPSDEAPAPASSPGLRRTGRFGSPSDRG